VNPSDMLVISESFENLKQFKVLRESTVKQWMNDTRNHVKTHQRSSLGLIVGFIVVKHSSLEIYGRMHCMSVE